MVTAAPSAAAWAAHAAPMPVPPPVTSTPVPSSPPEGFLVAGILMFSSFRAGERAVCQTIGGITSPRRRS
jgi:hypothetical protein